MTTIGIHISSMNPIQTSDKQRTFFPKTVNSVPRGDHHFPFNVRQNKDKTINTSYLVGIIETWLYNQMFYPQ